ncbi:hypothetical protein FB45DRAFT_907564 [Roridomyces roridus]|uniref:Uncharacterized protein n=1 Tax=Roridomyces roridus TaxID=1738132 RepID=A0AAD7C1W1_9AGAR|nr:hypothetical protein FB45DRAFT_907564 [Roridomyces roridus]
MEDSPWSRIPTEMAQEITAHNADDAPTLRAMSLVSRATRFLAIIHLFSSIFFSCVEDFGWWLDMLERTPDLATVVRTVKFSSRDTTRSKRCLGLDSVRRFSYSPIVPVIPPLPRVDLVVWNSSAGHPPVPMMAAHMALFPRVRKLQLRNVVFHSFAQLSALIGACAGRLRSLSFEDVIMDEAKLVAPVEETSSDLVAPDLTALDELRLHKCDAEPEQEVVARLIEHCPPTGLQSLILGGTLSDDIEACSLATTEKLLQFAAPSLVNLVLESTSIPSPHDRVIAMFGRLPVFAALETFTVWLGSDQMAKTVVNALEGAPNLTRLNFRIPLFQDGYSDVRDALIDILWDAFPWGGSGSMKTVLTRKFPSCRRIVFQFCLLDHSDVHFRRGARRRLKRRLKEKLEESGAELDGEYLQVEWLDEDFNPVVYRETNGKPFWSFSTVGRLYDSDEPETEASDCESESSDSSDSVG